MMVVGVQKHTFGTPVKKSAFPTSKTYVLRLQFVFSGWFFHFHCSVSDGIVHFKAGRQSEAIGYLNKALQMDTDNVEALVARGAM